MSKCKVTFLFFIRYPTISHVLGANLFPFFFFRRTRNLLLFSEIMLNIMSKLLKIGRNVNARISM